MISDLNRRVYPIYRAGRRIYLWHIQSFSHRKALPVQIGFLKYIRINQNKGPDACSGQQRRGIAAQTAGPDNRHAGLAELQLIKRA